jgi:hypothetical protein
MPDQNLRKLFRKNLKKWHWASIETGATESGVADLNGCYCGVEAWIECKAADAMTVEFELAQCVWIGRRVRSGGRVFVAVRRAMRELWLLDGGVVNRAVAGRLALGTVGGDLIHMSQGRWDWPAVHRLLCGEKTF